MSITTDIQQRVQKAVDEMNSVLKEREDVTHAAWVARIAQEHLLMLGPGGEGKSFFARTMRSHISNCIPFEIAFDETTDPSAVFGPPDIKAMVEDGKTRRIPTGMMPEATDSFTDEFFNANGPLLHSVMPLLNERIWHNNGMPTKCPLRQNLMGTNKLNADADQAALWDRVHFRLITKKVSDRNNQIDMVTEAITRMALNGRGISTQTLGLTPTTVTVEELDLAHAEALGLAISTEALETYFDLRDELEYGSSKVSISSRRTVESMAAIMANAWLRGHEEVQVSDLDILVHMWWNLQDQIPEVRKTILGVTNPGVQAAMQLLDDLEGIKKELKDAKDSQLDSTRLNKVGIAAIKDTEKLEREAKSLLATGESAGTDVTKVKEVLARASAFKFEVGRDIFSLTSDDMTAVQAAER